MQYQLYDLQAQYTKWAVPPRAWNDTTYRTEWIRFNAEQATATAFDPTWAKYDDQMRRLAIGIRNKGGNMMKMALGAMGGGMAADAFPKMEAATLWTLIDVLVVQSERRMEVNVAAGNRELDPDRMPTSVQKRMMPSSIAQAYLRFLEPDEGLELIARLGISHEFVKPEVVNNQKACGGCGSKFTLLPGATCVVCDSCGVESTPAPGSCPAQAAAQTMCVPEG